jgi:hypothetical protein
MQMRTEHMTTPTPAQRGATLQGAARRRRGSAMILAVAAVLLLLLVGLGYLSAAQISRMGATGVARAGNTDSAVEQTVDLVGKNIAAGVVRYTQTADMAEQAGLYPTNPDPYHPWLASTQPTDDDGTSSTMTSGQTDGDWRRWVQISRLLDPATTNTFYSYVNARTMAAVSVNQNDISARRVGAPYWTDDVNVDADGDGMADSKWTLLPIAGKDGMVWVAAVRVVDESGRVNVNTATEAEWIRAGTRVLGATPADIDLKRLLAEIDLRDGAADSGAPNWGMDPINAGFLASNLDPPTLMGYTSSNSTFGMMADLFHVAHASGGSGLITTNNYATLVPMSSNFRMTVWTSTGSNLDLMTSNLAFRKYGIDSLTDLRRRGGLPAPGWSAFESALDGRSEFPAPVPYPGGNTVTGVGPLLASLALTDQAIASGGAYLTTNRIKASVRSDLTTYNVSRPYRPRWLTGRTGILTSNDVKLSPNFELPPTTTNYAAITNVYAALLEAFSAPETTNYYGNTASANEASRYAAAMLANLMTYRSPTEHYDPGVYATADEAGRLHFGQQLQPFFTEAVAMIAYTDLLDPETTNGSLIDEPTPFAVNSEFTGQYVAVEIANPWADTLELTTNTTGGFFLRVNDGTGQAPVPLWDTSNGILMLTSNERLVIYSRDSLNTQSTNIDAALQATAAGMPAAKKIGVDGLAWVPGSGSLSFELYYSTNGSTMILVDRLMYTSNGNVHGSGATWPPLPLTTTNTDTGADGNHFVISASIQRDDRVLANSFPRYIMENPIFNLGVETSNGVGTGGNLTGVHLMGDGVDNANNLDATLAGYGVVLPNMQLFHKRGDLDTIGELANVLIISNRTGSGADLTIADGTQWEQTISEQLGNPYGDPNLVANRDNGRLTFKAFVRHNPPRVPIAATVFDQFSLLSGSSQTAGSAAPLVFGQINPNTATRRALEVLPYVRGGKLIESYKSQVLSEPDVARGIIAYRDRFDLAVDPAIASGSDLVDTLNFVDREAVRDTANPMSPLVNLRTEQGFASVGELMMVRREQAGIALNNNDLQFAMNRQAFDTFDAVERDGDMTPGTGDGYLNDYEEEMLHFNRISNVVSLHSDVFVAYVVLQGRRFDPLTSNFEVGVERRFMVGFDRSNVLGDPTKSEKPRILFFMEDR